MPNARNLVRLKSRGHKSIKRSLDTQEKVRPAKTPHTTEAAKRPRIQDVAAHVGVAVGTVSAVLNSNGRVSEETRRRIRLAMEELGYRPGLYASNLARRHTRLLGVVVSNLQNPFFAETAQAVEEEAARHGYQISLMATNFSPDHQRAAIGQLLQARIAGLAVLTSEHDEAARQLVVASSVPAVFLDLPQPQANIATLRVDARGGMHAAVEHLLRLGHRSLLFVRNSQQVSGRPLRSHVLRNEGFAAAVRGYKTSNLRTRIVDLPGAGADAGQQAVDVAYDDDFFSAVIAATDNVALGVYRGLQAMGLQIPTDVSVVGFDNAYFSRFLCPPLTTVDVPRAELSRLVMKALFGADRSMVLQLGTSLVVRESTAVPVKRSAP